MLSRQRHRLLDPTLGMIFATNGRGRFYADYELSTSRTINYVTAYGVMGRPTAGQAEFFLNGAGTGGSPTAPANKVPLTRTQHVQYNEFRAGILRAVRRT